ncbi:MAG: hypothetical protein ACXWDN_17525 [Limisphaerales bacterium]
MQHPFRSRIKIIAFCMSSMVAIGLSAAFAQSGSTGGSIGNDEKSLSGSRDAPRTVEPTKPTRRSKPDTEEPRGGSRTSGGGGGNFDGAWATVSVGCGGVANGAIVITSGRILGEGLSGHVNPNGSATAAGASGGVTWTSSGRFSSRTGSGSYRRSDGCVGSWTASKQ